MSLTTGTPQSIAARIKMARKMAGLATQAQLLQEIEGWKPSRLGNYEAAVSTPGPEDIRKIAEATEVSPCWLMFGDGPIRPNARDLQAIRHQNLAHEVEARAGKRGAIARFAKAMGMSKHELEAQVDNPFEPVSDGLARRFEQALEVREGWMSSMWNMTLCASLSPTIFAN